MSNKTDRGYWVTSAADIKPDNIDAQLYRNASVDDFLDNKFFIIAEKGVGKTLLLKKKKYDLFKSKSELFIPNGPDLDIPADFSNLPKNTINMLEYVANTKFLWSLAIQLSAIKRYDKVSVQDEIFEIYSEIFKVKNIYSTPSEIFHFLIKDIPKALHNYSNYNNVILAFFNQIHIGVYIFIDRLDQAMLIEKTKVSRSMWTAMQIGLLEAAWDLKEHNPHVKTYCSIREEVYNNYYSEIKANLSSMVCSLNYRENELHELLNTLSRYYENGRTIEDIVGFEGGKFIHSKTGAEETVFNYLLRHTQSKPRDLIRLVPIIKTGINSADKNERIEELRIAANTAAKEIARNVFFEKERFLDCLLDVDVRNKFLSMIPKNILSQKMVCEICRKFNDNPRCTGEVSAKCAGDGCLHPFCVLYNIGLLGYVQTDHPRKQVFKNSNEEGTVNHVTGRYSYYIVHPILCEIIKDLRYTYQSSKYIVTPGITTGNGIKWDNNRAARISDFIDYVINSLEDGLPLTNYDDIIQELKDEIRGTEDTGKLFKSIKRKIRRIMKREKIFLSYCGKDEEIVDEIYNELTNRKLTLTRDKIDLKYKQSLRGFMDSLAGHDYVITVVSDSYLKSKYCMYEIGRLLENENYKSKTLQIILPDAKIFDDNEKYGYIEYWRNEKRILEERLRNNLDNNNISLIERDLKDYDDIVDNLPKFIDFLRGEKGMLLDNLKKSGYSELLDYINKNKVK
jgi:hypothetical protein